MEQLKEDDLAVLRGGRRDATSFIRQQSFKIFRLPCYAPAMYRVERVPPPFPPTPPTSAAASESVGEPRVGVSPIIDLLHVPKSALEPTAGDASFEAGPVRYF